MRLLKTQVLLRFLNSYIVDSPEPANISYMWNFGSLLGICLIIQILTGAFLAMHYTPNVDFAFNSVEHIMRDVNNGWIIRYTHANVASFFFIFVYMHIGRGLYYSSYKSPRVLVWSIGVIILILMMAKFWPNCDYDLVAQQLAFAIGSLPFAPKRERRRPYLIRTVFCNTMLPINKARTKALLRIGPHNKEILDLIICGMLGDFWADSIPGKKNNSTRVQIEQNIINSAYIHHLTLYFYKLGYCSKPVPVLVKKQHENIENTFNYRLTLFTFTSFN